MWNSFGDFTGGTFLPFSPGLCFPCHYFNTPLQSLRGDALNECIDGSDIFVMGGWVVFGMVIA